MPKEYFNFATGTWQTEKPEAPRKHTHSVIADTIDPVESHADGRIYDSKSQLRRGYKAHGFIEKGNDRDSARQADLPDPIHDVLRACEIHKLR